MISFDSGGHRFHPRAAVVITERDKVLLHQREGDCFRALPGGRVEAGETAKDAAIRELREELAADIVCGHLILVIENFFHHVDVDKHEVRLYFAASLAKSSRFESTSGPMIGSEGDAKLIFAWFDKSRLRDVDIRPALLAEALAFRNVGFRHVVHRDPSR